MSWLPVSATGSGRWAVDRVSFDGSSPGHSAGEGARYDFGDGRHVGIGFPGGEQSARCRVGRISPNLRSPTRDEENRHHHLCRPSRLRTLEDYAAMHARDKGVGDAVLVTPSTREGRTN